MPDVELWQACALSLELDPYQFKFSEVGRATGTSDHAPLVEPESFRTSTEGEAFHKRLKLLEANLFRREHFRAGILNMSRSYKHHVRLQEFSAWAKGIGWTLPSDFPAERQHHFAMEARPTAVSSTLLALPPDTRVSVSWRIGRHNSDSNGVLAGRLVQDIKKTLATQAEDFFTVNEVAQIMADAREGKDGKAWVDDIRRAHRVGVLAVRDGANRHPFYPARPSKGAVIPAHWIAVQQLEHGSQDLVRGADVDAWLRPTVGYGFPVSVDLRGDAKEGSPGSTWPLNKPKRCDGLATPVYRVLKVAHDANGQRPTARDVLDAFRTRKPLEIVRVQADGCDYYGANGEERSTDLDKLRKRIEAMTKALTPG